MADLPLMTAAGQMRAASPVPYDQEDFDVLVKTVWAEARGEPAKGQQAVTGVIMNRALSSFFPNSIKEVALQGQGTRGAQFSAWGSAPGSDQRLAIEKDIKPEEYQRIAANILPVLTGNKANPAGSALNYGNPNSRNFTNVAMKKAYEAEREAGRVRTIGRHEFFTDPAFQRAEPAGTVRLAFGDPTESRGPIALGRQVADAGPRAKPGGPPPVQFAAQENRPIPPTTVQMPPAEANAALYARMTGRPAGEFVNVARQIGADPTNPNSIIASAFAARFGPQQAISAMQTLNQNPTLLSAVMGGFPDLRDTPLGNQIMQLAGNPPVGVGSRMADLFGPATANLARQAADMTKDIPTHIGGAAYGLPIAGPPREAPRGRLTMGFEPVDTREGYTPLGREAFREALGSRLADEQAANEARRQELEYQLQGQTAPPVSIPGQGAPPPVPTVGISPTGVAPGIPSVPPAVPPNPGFSAVDVPPGYRSAAPKGSAPYQLGGLTTETADLPALGTNRIEAPTWEAPPPVPPSMGGAAYDLPPAPPAPQREAPGVVELMMGNPDFGRPSANRIDPPIWQAPPVVAGEKGPAPYSYSQEVTDLPMPPSVPGRADFNYNLPGVVGPTRPSEIAPSHMGGAAYGLPPAPSAPPRFAAMGNMPTLQTLNTLQNQTIMLPTPREEIAQRPQQQQLPPPVQIRPQEQKREQKTQKQAAVQRESQRQVQKMVQQASPPTPVSFGGTMRSVQSGGAPVWGAFTGTPSRSYTPSPYGGILDPNMPNYGLALTYEQRR